MKLIRMTLRGVVSMFVFFFVIRINKHHCINTCSSPSPPLLKLHYKPSSHRLHRTSVVYIKKIYIFKHTQISSFGLLNIFLFEFVSGLKFNIFFIFLWVLKIVDGGTCKERTQPEYKRSMKQSDIFVHQY